MSESMVEIVARAIAKSAHGDEEGWSAWTEEARAAIEAHEGRHQPPGIPALAVTMRELFWIVVVAIALLCLIAALT